MFLAPHQRQCLPHPFPPRSRDFRLDLDCTVRAGRVMHKATPLPIVRARNQPALDRIAMDVTQFLDPLAFGPYRHVVVTNLPAAALTRTAQLPRYHLLQHLDGNRERRALRFADQQMHVLRHHDISVNVHAISAAYPFQIRFEDVAGTWFAELGLTTVATEGDEVQTVRAVKSLQAPGHDEERVQHHARVICAVVNISDGA